MTTKRKNREIKFAVMSDLHIELIHDGKKRLEQFLAAAEAAGVDFIIHLGDFGYPNDTTNCVCPREHMPENIEVAYDIPSVVDKDALLKRYNSFHIPTYHVMGNHEFDFRTPETAFEAYKTGEHGYYSFKMGGWHFIVLDGNYYRDTNGNIKHYNRGDYFHEDMIQNFNAVLPYINREQLDWLREELRHGDEPVVMFSHQPLFEYDGGINNLAEFQNVIGEAKANGRKIRMCMNGHLHVDDLDLIDGTYYYNMNSASNMWIGKGEMERARFSEKTERDFPNLKYILPYSRVLYAIVTLTEDGAVIDGTNANYVRPGPRSIGYTGKISSKVRSHKLEWKN